MQLQQNKTRMNKNGDMYIWRYINSINELIDASLNEKPNVNDLNSKIAKPVIKLCI